MDKYTIQRLSDLQKEYVALYGPAGLSGISVEGVHVKAETFAELLSEVNSYTVEIFWPERYPGDYYFRIELNGVCFYSVINIQEADALGLTIPEPILDGEASEGGVVWSS